jgi:hypothetical protein
VQLLGVVSEARTRLLREQGGKVPPKHGNGDGADGRVGVDRRLSEAPRLRRAEAGRQNAGLVFAQPSGLKTASGTQPFHERLEWRDRSFRNLDLHATQSRRRPAAPARGLD